ncbi:MAG: hypothetical protein HZA90_00790 [Verrucomicrobia bacterium]|nr:hypothetical protein [Verrucomicrobiota bacterium]
MDLQETGSAPQTTARWPGYLLGLYAITCGVLTLTSIQLYPPGWGNFTRPLLAVWGITAGLMLLVGDPWWKGLLRVWLLVQVVVLTLDPSGPITKQAGPWMASQNLNWIVSGDQVIQARGAGVNFAAIVLFALAQWILARRWHPKVPDQLWHFQVLRFARTLFVAATVAGLGYLGWQLAPPLLARDALFVIHSPVPGADVYAEGRKLGSTPLVVTHEKMVSWGLSKPSSAAKCVLIPTSLDEGLHLVGNSGAAAILFKPPAWCASQFATCESEWGPRAIPFSMVLGSNRCDVMFVSQAQPGVILSMPEGSPRTGKPGQPAQFAVAMKRNPAPLQGAPARATLGVTFARGTSQETAEVTLPAEWASTNTVKKLHQFHVTVPKVPGKYSVRFQYQLFGGTNGQQRLDAGWSRTYGFLEVK